MIRPRLGARAARAALLLGPMLVASSCLKSLDEGLLDRDASSAGGTGGSGGSGGDASGCIKSLCEGACVDTSSDPKHCGGCNDACAQGEVCSAGQCKAGGCAAGQTDCSGACVDLQTSPSHCGGCGQACSGELVCSAGKCSASCESGKVACGGGCVDVNVDPANCGSCGIQCPLGQACAGGKCKLQCVGGTIACNVADAGPKCVDLTVDPNNCGSCGVPCSLDKICQNGLCSCPSGTTLCAGTCVSLQSNPDNCGSCANKCVTPTPNCAAGQCTLVCGSGTINCNNACVDTKTDAQNCGACGKACLAGEVCLSGICCKSTQALCAGACTTLASDPQNCGSCGKVCSAPTPGCSGGTCVAGTRIMMVALNEGHNGALGGISGANQLCATQASAAGMGGSWKAFLSTSTQGAKTLFAAPLSALPVVNQKGQQLYPSWDNIWVVGSGPWPGTDLLYAFNGTLVDEVTAIPPTPTWTDADGWHGSNPDGTPNAMTCKDWTVGTLAESGIAGEWDFKYLLTTELHTCDYTAAVACVSLQP